MTVHWIAETLRASPELAIFLTLAIGFWVGSLKFGSFSLGAVTGTLLAGVLVGQLGIAISPQVKSVFFIMFLFAVGFGVGPQFVRGIANDGLPQAIFAIIISALCLVCVYVAAIVSGYGPGMAEGLLAGSQTISASIGLATDAINRSGLPTEQIQAELNAIPVAYAVTYLFGTVGTGWMLAFLGPKLLRINLAQECERYEREMNIRPVNENADTAWHNYIIRAYRLKTTGLIAGKTVAEAEQAQDTRIFLENLRRDGRIIPFTPTTLLREGDIVAVSGPHDALVYWSNHAEEVADQELIEIPVETVDVVVTSKQLGGQRLVDLSTAPYARGIYINAIRRGSMNVEIPVLSQTAINRGDIINITGSRRHVADVIANVGYADRPTNATSMVLVGGGIFVGGLLGSLVLPVGGVPITLSSSGGALIAGLVLGWLRGVTPKLGSVPSASVWFMNTVGLNIFIAVVGISAGPTFIKGLQEAGVSVFFWGVFASAMPMLLAPLIGKYIFRFDPAINLGCCGGARTSTASVAMVADVAKSNVPMLGYTVPYAVSNTLLTMWGLVIVLLLA
ncbi:MAG: aspartate-alanine antiporter [Acetobacter fabarum]|jgi:putative transport protein|uniref:Aspartate-alanine antiporter n=1 Tax=Acetobacter fabarum TaxID=483199 RepID=A0A269XVZ6_9PROT|nr:aspartate-alanine antiporter [Acetobacter fabarum]MCI1244173.1 aspartate-alanine antiporter [Acetobacter fabarum]MCI1909235.1 aspartate-alanine antiporter [Acetobacter fabarum]MCI1927213.1 aspartate-alanine antiporter [Acetobacter fabarum]MCI1947213.1 aspartate-alanine antiporter [Acetobacter fabarum]MCI1988533.1 aspartate-alanine antiporter [Acetobacter fabarum]